MPTQTSNPNPSPHLPHAHPAPSPCSLSRGGPLFPNDPASPSHSPASLAAPTAEALEHLEYPKRLRKLLLTPEREVAVELALLRDNGEVATFNAYRVQVGAGCLVPCAGGGWAGWGCSCRANGEVATLTRTACR